MATEKAEPGITGMQRNAWQRTAHQLGRATGLENLGTQYDSESYYWELLFHTTQR